MFAVYVLVAIPVLLLVVAVLALMRNGPPASRRETERDLSQLSPRGLGLLRGRTMSERDAVRMVDDREAAATRSDFIIGGHDEL